MSENDKITLNEAVTLFIEDGNDLPAVRKIGQALKSDPSKIHDREMIVRLAKGCGGKSKMAIQGIAHFLQAHIRSDNTIRVSTRKILQDLTGMDNISFYTSKAPAFKYDAGNKEISPEKAGIIQLISAAFLKQDQPVLQESLGQKWDSATRISFIQETGMDEEILYSLARWHMDIASESKNKMDSGIANIIIANVERLNEVLEERHGHSLYIPDHVYHTAKCELPENRRDIPLPT